MKRTEYFCDICGEKFAENDKEYFESISKMVGGLTLMSYTTKHPPITLIHLCPDCEDKLHALVFKLRSNIKTK